MQIVLSSTSASPSVTFQFIHHVVQPVRCSTLSEGAHFYDSDVKDFTGGALQNEFGMNDEMASCLYVNPPPDDDHLYSKSSPEGIA